VNDVNWWLVALAFVLGLVLTGIFMVRRVDGGVAETAPAAVAPAADAPAAVAPVAAAPKAAAPEAVAQEAPTAVEAPPPHGPGSARPGAGGSGPDGWTVKGNEESKLYHSKESPSYGVTRAEVWFRDAETAEAAGFNRWDSGKSQRGQK
jgi:hypothetical protein